MIKCYSFTNNCKLNFVYYKMVMVFSLSSEAVKIGVIMPNLCILEHQVFVFNGFQPAMKEKKLSFNLAISNIYRFIQKISFLKSRRFQLFDKFKRFWLLSIFTVNNSRLCLPTSYAMPDSYAVGHNSWLFVRHSWSENRNYPPA